MANFYPDELISEIIAANDIVDVVSAYVTLKKSGGTYKGLCPFHSEKTPSFSISSEKQLYHCFGCGAGGSVLQFVMNIENLDFIDALKFLAQRAGIALPEGDDQSEDAKRYKFKQEMYKLNASAARYFYDTLFGAAGEAGLRYAAARGLDKKTITKFGLGFAPDTFDGCLNHLRGQGFSEELIVAAGLAKKNPDTSRVYDFFRGRLMFPIIDIRGNVVAFGGRVMEDVQPKYLNSPDTPVFHKSNTLFALNFAKKTCHERLILCEGYMDVIALHKSGFTNAVATLGTALTPEHAKIISRYTRQVVLCYDSDSAGQKATARAIELFQNLNVSLKVLKMSGAKDPDEFIKKKGAEAFRALLEGSQTALLYRIEKLREQYNLDVLEEKIEFINQTADVFAQVDNEIERDVLAKEVAVRTGISQEALFAEIRKLRYKNSKKRNTDSIRAVSRPGAAGAKGAAPLDASENSQGMLASLLCSDTRVYNHLKDEISPDFFEDEAFRSFVSEVYRIRQAQGACDYSVILASLPASYAQKVTQAVSKELPYEDNLKAARQIVSSIKRQRQLRAVGQSGSVKSAQDVENLIQALKEKQ